MKEIEKLVKDKALFYWLDSEITMLHIAIYWIFVLLIDGDWAKWVAIVMTVISFIYLLNIQVKIAKLRVAAKDCDHENGYCIGHFTAKPKEQL